MEESTRQYPRKGIYYLTVFRGLYRRKEFFMNISVVYFVHPMSVAKYLVDVTILDCNASLEMVYDVLKSSDTYTVDGDLFRYEQIDFFSILSDLYERCLQFCVVSMSDFVSIIARSAQVCYLTESVDTL